MYINSMNYDADILIAGAGMVGAAQALSLAKQGITSLVFDRAKPKDVYEKTYDGRVSAISEASVRVYKHIGIWEDLEEYAGPIRDIRVADEDSLAHVHFTSNEVGEKPFGYMIPNFRIRQVLLEHCELHELITVMHESDITGINSHDDAATLQLANGERFAAPLLLVADGRHSRLRDMLGIQWRRFDYDQTAMVCTIKHEKDHYGLALELFLPSGPLAQLPMRNSHSCIVWTEQSDRARKFLELENEHFMEELAARMGGYLGEITLAGPKYGYPLHLIQAESYIDKRIALIGDAAHAIHPIAGQGVNLGYRDVAVLDECIGEAHRLGLDIGADSVLTRYQRWRRFDATSMVAATDGLNRLFASQMRPVKAVRRLGLSMFNRIQPVKEFSMLAAMGLKGDLPPMLQDNAA
jgi:2-octaprenyl-6-methoxyphenol hydroxylase